MMKLADSNRNLAFVQPNGDVADLLGSKWNRNDKLVSECGTEYHIRQDALQHCQELTREVV